MKDMMSHGIKSGNFKAPDHAAVYEKNKHLNPERIKKEAVEMQNQTDENLVNSLTENNPTAPVDKLDLSIYYDDLDQIKSKLSSIVDDLLKRQGKSLNDANIEVDEIARQEASQMIEEGGALSPENTAERIFSFAKAISGDDTSKFDLLKDAIDKGFEQAKNHFGELPDISNTTYDLIMEKLEAWKNGTEEIVEETSE